MSLPDWLTSAGTWVNLIGLALIGLAVLAQGRKGALEELKALSSARAERIAVLEAEQVRAIKDAETKHQQYESQIEVLMVRIEALTGAVALLERKEADAASRNIELQRQVEALERRPPAGKRPRRGPAES